MTTIETKLSPSQAVHWVVFCAAIDNFGDIGVCWRLARQLTSEHAGQVELWVDDWEALRWFLKPLMSLESDGACVLGVTLRHWRCQQALAPEDAARVAMADVVVEAFACDLPANLIEAMRGKQRAPLWLNLEYLSAQDWVSDCHLLPSPQGGGGQSVLRKVFFFPGFSDSTGGLLREQGLIEQHDCWQQQVNEHRRVLLARYSLPAQYVALPGLLWVSVFTYEGKALQSLLQALIESTEPSLCFVPEGRSLHDVAQCFGLTDWPVNGRILQKGSLSVCVLPFMSQDDFDQLLSLCDCNFVRGEDSFVRAQYAGRPFVWHIYPQEEGSHIDKLAAFLTLYSGEGAADDALQAFWYGWNQGEDCRDLWHYLRPQLPSLQTQARRWQQQLAEKPDLVTNLLAFYRAQRLPEPA